VHCAVPAPPTSAYDTAPVPDPPEVFSVNVSPNVTDDAFVRVNVDCAACATENDRVCCPAAEYTWLPAWFVAIVHVPAPRSVTTAPVAPALAVVFPATEHTAGVVDE